MVHREWSCAIAEMVWRRRTASLRERSEWNFVLSVSKAALQQHGKNIQYWILIKTHTGTSLITLQVELTYPEAHHASAFAVEGCSSEHLLLRAPGSRPTAQCVPLRRMLPAGRASLAACRKDCVRLWQHETHRRRCCGKEARTFTWRTRGFFTPCPPAYHGEITANVTKATRSCWHFPADSFLSPYPQENRRRAWLWQQLSGMGHPAKQSSWDISHSRLKLWKRRRDRELGELGFPWRRAVQHEQPQQWYVLRHSASPLSHEHPCQACFTWSHSNCAKSDASSALICACGVCLCFGKLHQDVDAHWCPSLVCVQGSPMTEITSWKWGCFGISISLCSNPTFWLRFLESLASDAGENRLSPGIQLTAFKITQTHSCHSTNQVTAPRARFWYES